jgi:hypothetical protein
MHISPSPYNGLQCTLEGCTEDAEGEFVVSKPRRFVTPSASSTRSNCSE